MATLTTVTITLTDGGATPVMTVDEAAKLVAATIRVFNHKKVTITTFLNFMTYIVQISYFDTFMQLWSH